MINPLQHVNVFGASTTLQSSGTTEVSGAMVMIN